MNQLFVVLVVGFLVLLFLLYFDVSSVCCFLCGYMLGMFIIVLGVLHVLQEMF